ncbi:MAG: hypothetical protein M3Y87_13905 [Myxococcota bacterium]|nr:hypothetical protein [Myxococcota bacterium]
MPERAFPSVSSYTGTAEVPQGGFQMRTAFSFVIVVSLALAACGGEETPVAPAVPMAAAAPSAPSAPAAPAAAGAPAAAAADDPVVCCEFNGVAGSSTRSLCASYAGAREVPDAACHR